MFRLLANIAHKSIDKRSDGSVLIALSSPLMKRLFKTVLLIDLLAITIAYFFKTRIISFSKAVILMEEGLLGTVMEYMDAVWKDFIDEKFVARLVKFLLILIQKDRPTIVILLGDKNMLESRWIKRQSVYETEAYLKSQHHIIEIFRRYFRESAVIIEDKGSGIISVHKAILAQLYGTL
jgi:hypothetical protein